MKLRLLFFLLLGTALLQAQNLVLNPSFETVSSCPVGPGEFIKATNWDDVNIGADSCSSPDLVAGCSWQLGGVNSPNMLIGYQPSRTGSNHAGVILYEGVALLGCTPMFSNNYREYIQGQLSAPLVAGQQYCVSFYINLANNSKWGINSLGVYFSNSLVQRNFCTNNGPIPVTPQLEYIGPALTDTLNWVRVSWQYTATGGERYFVIGNFRTDANTQRSNNNCNSFHPYAYYFIDDVSVMAGSCTGCPPINLSATIYEATCNFSDGFIDLNVAGGIAPYAYTWNNGASAQDIGNLATGSYSVTVTDANGCTATQSFVVNSSGAPTITVNNVTHVSCSGNNDGIIDLTVQAPSTCNAATTVAINEIMYKPINSNGVDPNTGEYIELIGPPGANIGCYILTDGDWTITIPPNTFIPADGFFTIGNNAVWGPGVFDLDAENCACYTEGAAGGALLILTDGGEYLALFNAAGAFVQGVIYASPTTANTPPNGALSVGGVISTVGTSACVSSVTIPGPAAFQVAPGAASLGTSIIRSPDATGTWTVQPGGSLGTCNAPTGTVSYAWSNGANTEDISGLAGGVYTITATAPNGCVSVASVTVNSTSAISVTANTSHIACTSNNVGAINLTLSGGLAPYTFLWSNGATTEDISGLAGGVYAVTINDDNGCPSTFRDTIRSSTGLLLNPVVTQITCNGSNNGCIQLNPSGGIGALSYNWSNGNTTSSICALGPGSYLVTVTDSLPPGSGGQVCLGLDTFVLVQPNPIMAQIDSMRNVGCTALGSIAITTTGGTLPYSYLWSNGATTEDLSGLSAGIYYATIVDSKGCQLVHGPDTIRNPNAISLSLDNSNNVSCFGFNNGAIQISVNGGAAPFSYVWSNGASTEDLNSLVAGNYSVTTTDNLGCTATLSTSIIQPTQIQITVVNIDAPSCLNNDGLIDISVAGGSAPTYTYQWSNGASTQDINGLAAGTYSVTVLDGDGCSALNTGINLIAATPISITLDSLYPENCALSGGGAYYISVTGGLTTPYNYQWSNGVTTQDITGLQAGNYQVIVRDNSGCVDSMTFVLNNPLIPSLAAFIGQLGVLDTSIYYGQSILLDAGNDQTGLGVNYLWTVNGPGNLGNVNLNNPQVTATPTVDGLYYFTITATSADACIDTATLRLELLLEDLRALPTAFTPNNDGNNDVFRAVGIHNDFIQEFKIFNRWGQMVYNNSPLGFWDGTYQGVAQPTDVYIYTFIFKRPSDSQPTIWRGQVTLIR